MMGVKLQEEGVYHPSSRGIGNIVASTKSLFAFV